MVRWKYCWSFTYMNDLSRVTLISCVPFHIVQPCLLSQEPCLPLRCYTNHCDVYWVQSITMCETWFCILLCELLGTVVKILLCVLMVEDLNPGSDIQFTSALFLRTLSYRVWALSSALKGSLLLYWERLSTCMKTRVTMESILLPVITILRCSHNIHPKINSKTLSHTFS